ncbi:ABC transporter substrate-binding protein [Paenibacillus xylaniclasticus]|uniref:ABC transporter substrate-binding protein n=1 Tax=Paenibacillus xylaniclasticus TaxID=588083 RepID=UPI0013DEE0DB|nr:MULTISPECIES: ABC transporter substrate-binding protein [Paenibacillus]GFN29888.1 iron-uptake system-binding protein [Paenibacillus curdlanolyticus]
MFKKYTWLAALMIVLAVVLTACGDDKEDKSEQQETGATAAVSDTADTQAETKDGDASSAETKVIKYLDQEYTVPVKTERIVVTGALEAMEDSILMDIHPVGAISVKGQFPAMFSSIVDKAESVGEKTEPNFEKILELKPDVILASSKFDPAVVEQLSKIATTIPYSHVSTNWASNLELLGELTGKQDKAAELIANYNSDLEAAKGSITSKLSDKKVLLLRIRAGSLFVYASQLYFNPMLYEDLGLTIPAEVEAAKAQDAIALEKLAEINPDVLLVQFSEEENKDNPKALEELQNNPIFQSINASKNNQVFINIVDPLAQGGTAYSKIEFLKAFQSKLG